MTPTSCPFAAAAPVDPGALRPDERLVLPLHRRMVVQYLDDDRSAAGRVLHLYHGDKEVCFDEPDLFAFGEALAGHGRFVAAEALAWAPGLSWPRLQGLLETLLAEGVLHRGADDVDDSDDGPRHAAGERPSPLPPAPAARPRGWHELPGLMTELTGRPLEIGHLERVVPIFRIAHAALDADGRQVGEANVFPPALRLAVATRWRACIYDGSRYASERPMNVSALKSMRQHWGTAMTLLRAVREAYLRRYPEARDGFNVGQLERLATAVLALPTLLTMRVDRRQGGAALHPALSSLFRVTDGLRMVMHQMLFVPTVEPTRPAEAPVDRTAILAYAERNQSFHAEHGVCAGPRAMVDEFLAVIVEGRSPRDGFAPVDAEPALVEARAAVEPALDYALHGLQAYATVFSLWPAMAGCYQRLGAAAEAAASAGSPAAARLRALLAAPLARIADASFLGREDWRSDRATVYDDMHAQCRRGVGLPAAPVGLNLQLATHRLPPGHPAAERLRTALAWQFGGTPVDRRLAETVQRELLDHLLFTQAVLREGDAVQGRINALLGRPAPFQPFSAGDLDLHNRLQGPPDPAARPRLPFLLDLLPAICGLRAELEADRLDLIEAAGAAPAGLPPFAAPAAGRSALTEGSRVLPIPRAQCTSA